ncbi:hypothetical protein AB0H36_47505 [Kribbella sp. NPDC050820]|uniref:hypothetical protein n=1 Tax=Kribbella sp. NPDC050820 TaxID=3155408 RepID=UPI0033D5444C
MAPRTSKALAAWTELNDRQQGLTAIYAIEHEIEAERRQDAARGNFDSAPAAVWRQIDFAHEPSLRELFGLTRLQSQLSKERLGQPGNGATMAALTDRGVITRDTRRTTPSG